MKNNNKNQPEISTNNNRPDNQRYSSKENRNTPYDEYKNINNEGIYKPLDSRRTEGRGGDFITDWYINRN